MAQLWGKQAKAAQAVCVRAFHVDRKPGESDLAFQVRQWDEANALFYGPERDLKNFPVQLQQENAPPVKLGLFPQTWFDAFYEKTGVTGPYLFGTGLVLTALSKELWVVEHGFSEFICFWAVMVFINKKFGKKISDYLYNSAEELNTKKLVEPLARSSAQCDSQIAELKTAIEQFKAADYIYQAKMENVALQLEEEYRKRLAEAHRAIKKRLDYQVEVEAAKKRYEHKHMVDWIVNNVIKGITPQQEKDALTQCIADLKKLSTA